MEIVFFYLIGNIDRCLLVFWCNIIDVVKNIVWYLWFYLIFVLSGIGWLLSIRDKNCIGGRIIDRLRIGEIKFIIDIDLFSEVEFGILSYIVILWGMSDYVIGII